MLHKKSHHLLKINYHNKIIESIYTNQPNTFFIDGFDGSGKTYLYNTLLAKIRSDGHIAMASSGVAALLLSNGRTAHSILKIPLKCTNETTCNIKLNSDAAKLIQLSKIFIWDEAPMLDI